MGKVTVYMPMQVTATPDLAAQVIRSILIEKFEIPIGDFDMEIKTVDGARSIVASGEESQLISSSVKAVKLFEALEALEEME